ncbi:MAG: hypothetical protein ACHWZW_02735 [Spirulina sp.]
MVALVQAEAMEVATILSLHQEVQSAGMTVLQKSCRLGELLIEQKSRVKHGQWGRWCAENLPDIAPRTISAYMAVAANWSSLEGWISAQGADVSLRSALNYLSESRREQALSKEEIIDLWSQVGRIVKRRGGLCVELYEDSVSFQFSYPKAVKTYEALAQLWEREGEKILEQHSKSVVAKRFQPGDHVRGLGKDGDVVEGIVKAVGFNYIRLEAGGGVLMETARLVDVDSPPTEVAVNLPELTTEGDSIPNSDEGVLAPSGDMDENKPEFRYSEITAIVSPKLLARANRLYSADKLNQNQIRGLFEWGDRQWVTVAGWSSPNHPLEAIGVVSLAAWGDKPTYSYAQHPDYRFTYCGQQVTYRGQSYVLTNERLKLQPEPSPDSQEDDDRLVEGGYQDAPEGSVLDGTWQRLEVGDYVVKIGEETRKGVVLALDVESRTASVHWENGGLETLPTVDLFRPQNGNGVADLTSPPPPQSPPQPTPQARMHSRLTKGASPATSSSIIDHDENDTPPWIWEPILKRWGRDAFDLDVSSNDHTELPARVRFTKENSALGDEVSWAVEPLEDECETLGWDNCPYSLNEAFSLKFMAEKMAGRLPTHFFVLNKTDNRTHWHQRYLRHADAVCRITQYVRFSNPTAPNLAGATFSLEILYFGPDRDRFAEAVGHLGVVMYPAGVAPLFDLPAGQQTVEAETSSID